MGMNRLRRLVGLAVSASLFLVLGNAQSTRAQAAQTPDAAAGKQQYTMPEYNAEQACGTEKDPAAQVKCLDDFVSKYPTSYLLKFVYPMYYQAYYQQKNWPKVIEYADKFVALGDKMGPTEIGPNEKYGALSARAFAFNSLSPADQATQSKAAMAAATAGLKLIPDLKKPDTLDDKAFDEQKKQGTVYLNGTAAQAAMVVKDYPNAITYYKAVLAVTPDEAITNYRLGQAYMASTPPQTMDGFWYIARAVSSKNATQQQSTQLKTYLRKLFVNYQQASCDSLIDAQMNELLQLAGSSAERPATYKVPSAADLDAARKDMTIASVIADLKAGSDKGKVTWLAACGLEFPDVPGKLMEVTEPATPADPVDLKLAFVTTQAEFDAATKPDMDVKVVGQPEAAKLEKDGTPRFTGTLVSYDPDPAFMLHWDKAKIKDEDLPKEKAPAKKPPVKRPAAKKPAA
jgi:tetratricopeptide (TPR) repeat protein